jgi:hypothetical protein
MRPFPRTFQPGGAVPFALQEQAIDLQRLMPRSMSPSPAGERPYPWAIGVVGIPRSVVLG